MQVKNTIALRVTRNHAYDLHENEVMDLLKSVESEIKDRSHKIAVRLEIEPDAPKKTLKMLESQLGILENYVFEINGPLNIVICFRYTDFLFLRNLKIRLLIHGSLRNSPATMTFSPSFVKEM